MMSLPLEEKYQKKCDIYALRRLGKDNMTYMTYIPCIS